MEENKTRPNLPNESYAPEVVWQHVVGGFPTDYINLSVIFQKFTRHFGEVHLWLIVMRCNLLYYFNLFYLYNIFHLKGSSSARAQNCHGLSSSLLSLRRKWWNHGSTLGIIGRAPELKIQLGEIW